MPKTGNLRFETKLVVKGELYRPEWKTEEEWAEELTRQLEAVIVEALDDFIPEAEV